MRAVCIPEAHWRSSSPDTKRISISIVGQPVSDTGVKGTNVIIPLQMQLTHNIGKIVCEKLWQHRIPQVCIWSNHFPWRWASQKNKTPDRTILKKYWAAKVRSSHGYRTRNWFQQIWFKHVDVRMCGAPLEMWQKCSKNSSPRKLYKP